MELDRGTLFGRRGWRWWVFTAAVLTGAVLMAGCAGDPGIGSGRGSRGSEELGAGQGAESREERPLVVTTIFPYYDFVRQVAGDRVRLKMIVPAGMDSHSFEPTPRDMIAMEKADVLICNGGEMEQWVQQVLDSLDTSHMKILTMMDYVEVSEEEQVEGMEDSSHQKEERELEYDEHIWTSPVKAQEIVTLISRTLSEVSPENRQFFQRGRDTYLGELKKLNEELHQVADQGRNRMILVADKFPFRYFADEYGLSYRAAFSGCSTDTEPSAKTIAYLIDRVREKEIGAVYYLELSSPRTAEIIYEETGAVPLLLHSCHNVTRKQLEEGVTYLQLMKGNVESLRKGLE